MGESIQRCVQRRTHPTHTVRFMLPVGWVERFVDATPSSQFPVKINRATEFDGNYRPVFFICNMWRLQLVKYERICDDRKFGGIY